MTQALWIAKTGLGGQQDRLAVISNNLANINTTGFKRARAVFEDLLYQNVRQSGGQTSENTQLPSGLTLGTGVRMVATQTLHTQGSILQTSNQMDLAIQGRGFFQILRPNGELAYTRNGEFQLDASGKMVNASGFSLQPDITVPPDSRSVTIGGDGIITVIQAGNSGTTQIGNMRLVDFVNPSGLQPIGGNLYIETASSGSPQEGVPGLAGLGTLAQGALEGSNVNVVEELVGMIETQRAYEMNSKAISTMDEMLQYVNNNL